MKYEYSDGERYTEDEINELICNDITVDEMIDVMNEKMSIGDIFDNLTEDCRQDLFEMAFEKLWFENVCVIDDEEEDEE